MDSDRFDRLVKGLGTGAGRRQVLTGLLGAGLAGVLGHRQVTAQRGPQCREVGDDCQGDDNPGKGNKCCSGLVCSNTGPGSGTCQPNRPPHVCDGKDAPNPCFPNDAPACGTSGTGRTCHCGTDIKGNLACYDVKFCNNPNPDIEGACTSNADCEARSGQAGAVCFSAENCCSSGFGEPATGCALPCPYPDPILSV